MNQAKKRTNKKPFLKKHWSNILFFIVFILFIIPDTRTKIQSWIVVPLIGSPEILTNQNDITIADYNVKLKDLQNKSFDLKDSKGTPILINFWATWCSPCLAELPGLVELYDEFGDQVDFYFVSNETSEKLRKFLKQKKLNIPVYRPDSELPEFYDTNSIPATYLISADGELVAKAKGMANWYSNSVKETIKNLIKN